MPNHLHLLIQSNDPSKTKQRLAIELRAWGRRFFPGSSIWEEVPDPAQIQDDHHLLRQIRYVHLNPCRAGLARDPFEWEWSTHLDATGCVRDPWIDRNRLAQIFKTSELKLGSKLHHYISGDPSVSVGGTAMVCEFKRGDLVRTDAPSILWASAAVLRSDVSLMRGRVRDLAIQTASHLGLRLNPDEWSISKSALYGAVARRGDPHEIALVLKILSDSRFKAPIS